MISNIDVFQKILSLRAISGTWAMPVKRFLCPSIFWQSCSLIFSLASYNFLLIVISHLLKKTLSNIYSQKAILIVSSWCPQQSVSSLFVTTVRVKYLPCPNCSNVRGKIQQITDLNAYKQQYHSMKTNSFKYFEDGLSFMR